MKKLLILFVALAALTLADEPKQITDAQRAKWWRLQAEAIAARVQAERAVEALETWRLELVKTCGGQELTASKDGEPTCSPKEPAKNAKIQ